MVRAAISILLSLSFSAPAFSQALAPLPSGWEVGADDASGFTSRPLLGVYGHGFEELESASNLVDDRDKGACSYNEASRTALAARFPDTANREFWFYAISDKAVKFSRIRHLKSFEKCVPEYEYELVVERGYDSNGTITILATDGRSGKLKAFDQDSGKSTPLLSWTKRDLRRSRSVRDGSGLQQLMERSGPSGKWKITTVPFLGLPARCEGFGGNLVWSSTCFLSSPGPAHNLIVSQGSGDDVDDLSHFAFDQISPSILIDPRVFEVERVWK